jgi:hypothetical protein
VLKEGIIWRIGNGSQVRIWEDPWLPFGITRQPATYKDDCPLVLVSELIDEGTCTWKKELINQYFHPNDVKIILSIPLREDTEDFIAWHFDCKGIFSVKSAYKIHVEMERRASVRQEGQGSETTTLKTEVFARPWKVQCPPKVHHFMWRLAHNSHPLYMNIARRGVELDTICAVCHTLFEDGGHLFLSCKYVKQRWRALLLEDVRLKLLPCSSSLEMLQEVLALSTKEKLLAISLLWNWWSERNKRNHGEPSQSIEHFQFNVRRHVDDWEKFLHKKAQPKVNVPTNWVTLMQETVKINIDAAFRELTGSGGWGAICRDGDKDVCFAAAGPLEHMRDAFHAEATALSHAIEVAESLGVGRVIFESDCLNLVTAVTTSDYSLSPIGVLLNDLRYQLRMSFIDASVVYAPRSCNKPAHELAALGVGVAEQTLWLSDYRLVTGDIAVS